MCTPATLTLPVAMASHSPMTSVAMLPTLLFHRLQLYVVCRLPISSQALHASCRAPAILASPACARHDCLSVQLHPDCCPPRCFVVICRRRCHPCHSLDHGPAGGCHARCLLYCLVVSNDSKSTQLRLPTVISTSIGFRTKSTLAQAFMRELVSWFGTQMSERCLLESDALSKAPNVVDIVILGCDRTFFNGLCVHW